MKRWNQEAVRAVQNYVRMISPKLGVGHWDITVGDRVASDKAQADITTCEGMTAVIQLGKRFFFYPASQQREILAHELCHLPGDWADHAVKHLCATKNTALNRYVALAFEQATEHATQHFARLLAPSLPLPFFPSNVKPLEVTRVK